MAGLRRFAFCLTIVPFVILGLVLLGRWASPVSGAAQPVYIEPSAQAGVESVSEAISGTYTLYFPYVNRSSISVCGYISVDTVWTAAEGSYRVSCDVTVLSGVTLTIEAGTRVEFMHSSDDLAIQGTLYAVGTDQDPISFRPVYGTMPGSWGQVAFLFDSSGVLDHAILEYGGGGSYYSNYATGMLYIGSDAVLVQNSVIKGSAARGIYISSYSPTIKASQILSNTDQSGGGMYIYFASPFIENNIIANNSANYGAGLSVLAGSPFISSNIFINNHASESGGGINLEAGGHSCSPSILSNILVSNTNTNDGVIYNVDCTPVSDHNDFWGNTGANYYMVTPGEHDISHEPMWVDPSSGDYHLASGSPCIDAGDPANFPPVDFEGDLRPMGIAADIGPDEFRTLMVDVISSVDEAAPGSLITYTMNIINRTPVSLTNVTLTDILPVEASFTGYQADGMTCTHDGAAWGGQLNCALDSLSFAPGESQALTVTVMLTISLSLNQYVTNPVTVSASAGGETLYARDQARIHIFWCTAQLNEMRVEDNLQAVINASILVTDVVKVSGYCRVHDLLVDKTLILQGGWRADFAIRDPGVYTTTLDAQRLGRVILVDGDVAPVIDGFVITGGYVWGFGGGISILSGSPTIQNNSFIRNDASIGGGCLSNLSGNPLIQDNSFTLCYAYAEDARGGGLYNGSGSPLILRNVFKQNQVIDLNSHAGGIYNDSGSPIIQENIFIGNISADLYNYMGNGGALYTNLGSPAITHNIFIGNHAAKGGGVFIGEGSPVIQNNIFSGNSATDFGGGIHTQSGSPIIEFNVFYENTSVLGGGIHIGESSNPIVRSNIVVNNTASEHGGGIYGYSGTITLDYNDVWNNTGGNYYGVDTGLHDISADPLLVDPTNGDFHLSPGSPCIDAGDPVNYPPTDFEGEARPHGAAPDIGADEYY
jgi:uncharacterized repeat protein (TIGR01451 family)